MSDQNILPSASKLYPTIPEDKKNGDFQKEYDNEIPHYKNVKNKHGKEKCIRHTTSTVTVVIAVVLSSSGLAAALSGIGIIAGLPLAGLAALFGSVSISFIVKSKKLNSKITKREKTISIAEAKHIFKRNVARFANESFRQR